MPPVFIAYPTPRGMVVSRCKQVSRLGFYLLAHLPAFAVVSCCAFVSFTVTGIARNFHPIPVTLSIPEERRASLRRYTGYSFVTLIIGQLEDFVNPLFVIDFSHAIRYNVCTERMRSH